jgi:hypothetical protein
LVKTERKNAGFFMPKHIILFFFHVEKKFWLRGKTYPPPLSPSKLNGQSLKIKKF